MGLSMTTKLRTDQGRITNALTATVTAVHLNERIQSRHRAPHVMKAMIGSRNPWPLTRVAAPNIRPAPTSHQRRCESETCSAKTMQSNARTKPKGKKTPDQSSEEKKIG